MDAAVGDELGERDPGDLAADRVEARDDDGLGRVVDDQVDAGRLLEGADVAALAADDPALHLVAGRWTTVTVCSAVWSAATRCIAVTMISRAFSWASSRARRSIDRASLTASCSASSRIGLEEHALGVLGGHAGDPLEGDDLLLVEPGELLALVLELALAVDDLAALLLEHVGALVELLVALRAGGARGSGARSRLARASSSASRCRRSFSSFASRIMSFCWVRASATIRAALSWAALMVWLGNDAAGDESHGNADDARRPPPQRDDRVPSSVPPIRRIARRRRWRNRARATRRRRSLGLGSGQASTTGSSRSPAGAAARPEAASGSASG